MTAIYEPVALPVPSALRTSLMQPTLERALKAARELSKWFDKILFV